MRLGRQLPWLSNRDEPCAQLVRHGCAENEAAAFDADNVIDLLVGVRCCERANHVAEPLRVAEERRDVVEQNAGLRKVRNVANLRAQMVHMVWQVWWVWWVGLVRSADCH